VVYIAYYVVYRKNIPFEIVQANKPYTPVTRVTNNLLLHSNTHYKTNKFVIEEAKSGKFTIETS